MAGVSTRTLRYYDEIGLLKPVRTSRSGHRIYGQREVNQLQQVLFYRMLEFPLERILDIVQSEGFDELEALRGHLAALESKRDRLTILIDTVRRSMDAYQGGESMKDEEKFAGFKETMIRDNEENYGREVREKYGDRVVDASNQKLMGLTRHQYDELQKLSEKLNDKLKEALVHGQPDSPAAQEACALHQQWLEYFWPVYSKEAHRQLGQMYVDDERFGRYYDAIAPGCALFLRDALDIYCRE